MNLTSPFILCIAYLAVLGPAWLKAQAPLPFDREVSESSQQTQTPISQSAASVATGNSMTILDDSRKLSVGDVLSEK